MLMEALLKTRIECPVFSDACERCKLIMSMEVRMDCSNGYLPKGGMEDMPET